MSNHMTRHERKPERMEALPSMLIDVQIQQPRGDCPIYAWEHERGAMRLTGVHHGSHPAARLPHSQPGDCPVFAAVHALAALAQHTVS